MENIGYNNSKPNDNEFNEIIENNYELNLESSVPKKIFTEQKDLSIRELLTMKQEGDLILRPEYQRKFVMDIKLSSRLIESLLMDVPIPVIYLAEEIDGKYSVIDGQQRLTSFISFLEGKFPLVTNGNQKDFALKSLNVLKELNNKTFSQLERSQQTKIKTSTLNTIIIKKESPEDIKFEIFERLNTGSIKLNEDEIRNTIYRGEYISLLSELEENSTFHKIVSRDIFKKRMIYRGMILRFFALSEKSYLNYKPSMKQFCNKELRDNQNMNTYKKKEYRDRFLKCIDLVSIVFGKNAFRRYSVNNNNESAGKYSSTRINMALFDIQMCGFVNYEKNQIVSNSDSIRKKLIDLMSSDKNFIDSIEIATSDRNQVIKRFQIWMDALKKIIGTDNKEPRLYSLFEKQQLFEENPQCAICKQQILSIEDAEVDHRLPYSKGGKTDLINSQLTHKHCNRSKSNKIELHKEKKSDELIDISANYYGKIIHAKLNLKDFSVEYKNKKYNSPSGAAIAAKINLGADKKTTANGWLFWKYKKNNTTDDCFIDELRNYQSENFYGKDK